MPIKALLGIIGGISQNIRDKKNRKKQLKELNKKQEKLDGEYYVEANQNYLEKGEPKKELLQLSEQKLDHDMALNNEAVKIGTSAEAEVAKAAEMNKKYSDAVRRLAKPAAKKKEMLQKEYERKSESIDNKKSAIELKKKTLSSR